MRDRWHLKEVRIAKATWLRNNLPAIDLADVCVLPYGTRKDTAVRAVGAVLVDDDADVRRVWETSGGTALEPGELAGWLEALLW